MFGVEILYFLDGMRERKEAQQREKEEFRRALISSGKYDIKQVYPEYFSDETTWSEDPEDELDFSDVSWEAPGADEYADLMDVIRKNSTVVTNEGSSPLPPALPDFDDEQEWL